MKDGNDEYQLKIVCGLSDSQMRPPIYMRICPFVGPSLHQSVR